MPVVGPRPLPPNGFSAGVSSGAEAEAVEEVGVDGEAPEVGGGGGAGGSGAAGPGAGEGVGWAGGVVGVLGHWVAATWQEGWGGEAGEVKVGRVKEEEVVEVGDAEGGVGVGSAVVGPALWGLRHLLHVSRGCRGGP